MMIPLVPGLFVDNVEQWFTIRIAHEICNEKADRRPENILREICTVGREEKVFQFKQRAVGREGFFVEDIQSCALNPSLSKRSDERGFLHNWPSTDVDHDTCRLHRPERLLIDHSTRGWRQWRADHNVVTLPEHFTQLIRRIQLLYLI